MTNIRKVGVLGAGVPGTQIAYHTTGAAEGPFQSIGVIGLNTIYDVISNAPDPTMQQFAAVLKDEYVEPGKVGVLASQGFYTCS